MTDRGAAALSREDRERLRKIADVVFPRTAEMPSAGDVGACDMLVDRVARAVPSLAADASAALAATTSEGEAALVELRERNRRLFNRLMLLIASAYYMSTEVRERVIWKTARSTASSNVGLSGSTSTPPRRTRPSARRPGRRSPPRPSAAPDAHVRGW